MTTTPTQEITMSGRVYVIPAALDEPPRAVDLAPDLLTVLHREIGCDCIDSTPNIQIAPGVGIRIWVDDTGLLTHPDEHNDRAIEMARAHGYMAPDFARTVVVTGAATDDGDTPPLREDVIAWLDEVFALAAATAAERGLL
jgi:hypothetical protein